MEQFANDLVRLIEDEQIKQLIIFGHSIGGKVGALLLDQLKQKGINPL